MIYIMLYIILVSVEEGVLTQGNEQPKLVICRGSQLGLGLCKQRGSGPNSQECSVLLRTTSPVVDWKLSAKLFGKLSL